MTMGLFEMAAAVTEKRAAEQGHSFRTKHYAGVIAYRQGHVDEAVKYFKQSLEINPNSGVTMAYLGHALWKLGRPKEAEPYYRDFIKNWGDNATIQERLRQLESL